VVFLARIGEFRKLLGILMWKYELGETSIEMGGDETDCEVAEWISQEEGVIQWLDFINMIINSQFFSIWQRL
jgi:hypothetical protein